jgi:alkylation response protein AidB-like acyl-CoA dehydrogenase
MDFSLSEEQQLVQQTVRAFVANECAPQTLALELIPDQGLREPDPDEVTMSLRGFTRGRWVSQYMFTLAYAIAGGTSNVQRNIIGEHVFGLPRDVRPGR